MFKRNYHKLISQLAMLCCFGAIILSTPVFAIGEFTVVTRDDGEIIPTPPTPISTDYVFSGYVCKINPGWRSDSEIRAGIYEEPDCGGAYIGFAAVCFRHNGIGRVCPHEDNPASSHIYDESLKPMLFAGLQRAMIEGIRVEVYRLSNTFDYPHYEGPLLYGNTVNFKDQPFNP